MEAEFDFMRQVLFVALSAVGLIATASLSTPAARPASFTGIQDRFCLQGRQWGYPGNCLFSTFEQCMATASGTQAYCGENPRYLFSEQRRGYRQPR